MTPNNSPLYEPLLLNVSGTCEDNDVLLNIVLSHLAKGVLQM